MIGVTTALLTTLWLALFIGSVIEVGSLWTALHIYYEIFDWLMWTYLAPPPLRAQLKGASYMLYCMFANTKWCQDFQFSMIVSSFGC